MIRGKWISNCTKAAHKELTQLSYTPNENICPSCSPHRNFIQATDANIWDWPTYRNADFSRYAKDISESHQELHQSERAVQMYKARHMIQLLCTFYSENGIGVNQNFTVNE